MTPTGLLAAIESHLRGCGMFDVVNMHESASPPGRGINAEVWEDSLTTVRAVSGLNVVSVRIVYTIRVLCLADREPRDTIDRDLLDVVSKLFETFCGDFELGGQVLQVDLLGAHGLALSSQSGYLLVDGSTRYRIRTITLPLIIDDLWTEVA